jgi:hypothetical protein
MKTTRRQNLIAAALAGVLVLTSAQAQKDDHAFDGGKTYRLRVPPNPPAKQFWSVTLYEADTRILIQNKEQIADRSSRMDLLKNADDQNNRPRYR